MSTRNLFVSLFVLSALVLTACGSPSPIATVSQPPSVITLVENNDDVKNIYTTSHADGGYEDVSLEAGMAEAQFLCGEKQAFTFSVGNASTLNASDLLVTECPDLATGIRAQIVNTTTHYGLDCQNCSVTFAGEWEYGNGVSAWRGTIKVVTTPGVEPAKLVLVPVTMP